MCNKHSIVLQNFTIRVVVHLLQNFTLAVFCSAFSKKNLFIGYTQHRFTDSSTISGFKRANAAFHSSRELVFTTGEKAFH